MPHRIESSPLMSRASVSLLVLVYVKSIFAIARRYLAALCSLSQACPSTYTGRERERVYVCPPPPQTREEAIALARYQQGKGEE